MWYAKPRYVSFLGSFLWEIGGNWWELPFEIDGKWDSKIDFMVLSGSFWGNDMGNDMQNLGESEQGGAP